MSQKITGVGVIDGLSYIVDFDYVGQKLITSKKLDLNLYSDKLEPTEACLIIDNPIKPSYLEIRLQAKGGKGIARLLIPHEHPVFYSNGIKKYGLQYFYKGEEFFSKRRAFTAPFLHKTIRRSKLPRGYGNSNKFIPHKTHKILNLVVIKEVLY